ncbi:hypothetical protein BMS3Abin10_02487 [bacterium BMS3Abin10]|nr:hypothetical protein BMS3Abin10_02487 [bacterium BMS3Abin10]GBE39416.1 hypothetical protein BMS3Bbin08_02038 [bacterium BMS3Bbin08]
MICYPYKGLMKRVIINIAVLILLSSCAAAPVEKRAEPPEKALPVSEQESRALESFTDILEISGSSRDRQAVLPEMEKIYMEIIDYYPDAALAQESYLKLVEIYLREYSPPSYAKAEGLYKQFRGKYPGSVLRGFIEETIAKSYYLNAEWGRLLNLTAPIFKQYISNSLQRRPALIYMYSEANFNLGRLKDAEDGYRLMMKLFPGMSGNVNARARLEEIRKKLGKDK